MRLQRTPPLWTLLLSYWANPQPLTLNPCMTTPSVVALTTYSLKTATANCNVLNIVNKIDFKNIDSKKTVELILYLDELFILNFLYFDNYTGCPVMV